MWLHNPEGFDRFSAMLQASWEGITIQPPERVFGHEESHVYMFVEEHRRARELYWCGFGLQIWCQILTWASKVPKGGVFVVDEPETYLHPTRIVDMDDQKQPILLRFMVHPFWGSMVHWHTSVNRGQKLEERKSPPKSY